MEMNDNNVDDDAIANFVSTNTQPSTLGTKSLMKWKGVILSNDDDAAVGSGGAEERGTRVTSATTYDECDGGAASRMNSQRINGSGSGSSRKTENEEEQITAAIKPNNAINFSGYKV